MPSNTRRRLIDVALVRFKRDGFRNVGVEQIFGDVGISRTAFYKHFESKDDLMVEALDIQTRTLQDTFAAMVRERGGDSPADQLRALFDVVETIVESGDFHGCIFVNAAIEFPLPHDPAHQASRRNRAAMVDMIREIATRAGSPDPALMAEELCLLMEGVYVARQVTGRPDLVGVARRLAEDVLRRHQPDPAAQSAPSPSRRIDMNTLEPLS